MASARIVRASEGVMLDPWVGKVTGGQTGGRFDFMVGEVGYLSGPPLHLHRLQDDSFYVLHGVLTVQAEDEVFELQPGDFVTVPPNTRHTFDNVSRDQGPVRAINLMTPGGFDGFFLDVSRLGAAAADPVRLAETADRHGVVFVGPTLGEKLGLSSELSQ